MKLRPHEYLQKITIYFLQAHQSIILPFESVNRTYFLHIPFLSCSHQLPLLL